MDERLGLMNGFALETQHLEATFPKGVRTANCLVAASSPNATVICLGLQGAQIIQSAPDLLMLARSLSVPDGEYMQI